MKDSFLKTMAVCAAVSLFGSGAYTMYSGAEANLVSKVNAVIAAKDLAVQSAEAEVTTPQLKK
jgi:hypothetical protein